MNLSQVRRELLDIVNEIKNNATSKYEFAAIRAIQEAMDCLDNAEKESE